MCDGFWAVDDDVAPSPKVQLQPTTWPSGSVLPSVKLQAKPVQLEVKAALGDWFAAVAVTVIAEVPICPPLAAVIVADPGATPVTSPVLPSTVAAAVLSLNQVTVNPAVCPAATLAVGGVTVTDPTTGQVTVTLASPVTLPG